MIYLNFQLVYESLILILAAITGYRVRRSMNPFQKLIWLQLRVWIFFFLVAYIVTAVQRHLHLPRDNQAVFNLYLPVETILMILAARHLLKGRRHLITIALILFSCVYIVQLLLLEFSSYLYYADAGACFILGFLFVFALYKLLHEQGNFSSRLPDVLICSGVIVYEFCSIPYLTSFNFIKQNNPALAKILAFIVSDLLSNIRYLLIGLGFWTLKTKQK